MEGGELDRDNTNEAGASPPAPELRALGPERQQTCVQEQGVLAQLRDLIGDINSATSLATFMAKPRDYGVKKVHVTVLEPAPETHREVLEEDIGKLWKGTMQRQFTG